MNWHYPDTLLHWLLLGASTATIVFFAAGLTLYFERAARPTWVITVHYFSLVLAVAQVLAVALLPTRSDPFVFAAIVMYVTSIALFLAAIEAAHRTRLQRSFIDHPLPDRLITCGPFKWVRHPFCLGYLLGALAGPTGIDHWVAPLIALPLVTIAVSAAMREERVWLTGVRADEYREYQKRTGMFLPFIGRR